MSDTTGQDRPRLRRAHTKTKTGCDTCKRRRVKCDETRPYCMKCVSTGRTCDGYNPPRTWLFEPGRPRSQEPHTAGSSFEESNDTSAIPATTFHSGSPSALSTPESSRSSPSLGPSDPLTAFSIDWSTAHRDSLLVSFLQKYVSSSPTICDHGDALCLSNWASIGGSTAGTPRHEFLTTAFISLSMCVLSFQQGDSTAHSNAVKTYQQALPQLRRAISRLSHGQSESLRKAVIATCFAFAIGEYMLASDTNSDRHLEGTLHLIQHGGVAALEDVPLRRMFFDHRTIWIGRCFKQRKAPIYSTTEWLEASKNSADPLSRSLLQRLNDIGYEVLPLLQHYDSTKESAGVPQLLEVLTQLHDKIVSFTEWRLDPQLPVAELLPSPATACTTTPSAWDEDLTRKGLEVATSLNYYAAMMIHIYMTVLEIATMLNQHGENVESTEERTTAELVRHTNEILRTIDFCLNGTHGVECFVYTMFPLDACRVAYETGCIEYPEMTESLARISTKMKSAGFHPW